MIRRTAIALSFAVLVLGSGSALARKLPQHDELAKAEKKTPRGLTAEERRLIKPGKTLHYEERLGVPTFVWTAPSRADEKKARAGRARNPQAEARQHLGKYAALYGLHPSDVANAKITQVHDTGRGGVVVKFKEHVNGVEVFREELSVMMDRDLERVALSGYLSGATLSDPKGFQIDAVSAVATALKDRTGQEISASDLVDTGRKQGAYGYVDNGAALASAGHRLNEPARVKQVYYRLPEGLVAAYYVEVAVDLSEPADEYGLSVAGSDNDMYSYVISASDGEILFRNNLTQDASFGYRVWADTNSILPPQDSPIGNGFTPHPTGNNDASAPGGYAAPILQTLANVPFSQSATDPWLPDGATVTTGNNVEAYVDFNNPDGFSAGDLRPDVTSPGVFDRSYDPNAAPYLSADQRKASATHLFYVNNFLHDWFYDAGFDEAAGNAQADNYGRGGLAADSIKAEGQDVSGTSNANMNTPADGGRPRMQMYMFAGIKRVVVNSGTGLAASYSAGETFFGPQPFSHTGDVVVANDGVGTLTDGCTAVWVNAAAVAGNIAYVDRSGSCSLGTQINNANSNGATGLIIANNTGALVFNITGILATPLPILVVSLPTGTAIKAAIAAPSVVNVTLNKTTNPDGTLDTQVIEHEWGHYLTHRLIGNASGLGNNQGRSMGEGWGDFVSTLLTVREGDDLLPNNASWSGVYHMGGYASLGVSSNTYYFGIRRIPYSTDMTKNPFTFKHVTNGNPIIPPFAGPCDFGCDGTNNAQVHNSGTVWSTALWEGYAALLNNHPFETARTRMRDYLVASLKITPINPTFTEARDAVLAAAYAADLADHALFCEAFAKRGWGQGAVSPDRFSTTHAGTVESYLCTNDIDFVSASLATPTAQCDADPYLDNYETATLSVTLRNVGSSTLSNTTAVISSANPALLFADGGVMTFPPVDPFQETTGTIEVSMIGAVGVQDYYIDIVFSDPDVVLALPPASLAVRGNADDVPDELASDDVEPVYSTAWTPGGFGGAWVRILNDNVPPFNFSWFVPNAGNPADVTLTSPPLEVADLGGNFSFGFRHRFSFETVRFDGGVIEISTDGGGTWTDVGAAAAGYNGTLVAGGDNPLQGRPAYVNASAGYPAWVPRTVDLGTAFNGLTVQIRFRHGADANSVAIGWEVDDLVFTNITNTPFFQLVAEPTDTTPPVVSDPTVDRSNLWPPNHSMQPITVSYTASDDCQTACVLCPVTCSLSVTSNEAINGTGDGDTSPDWEVVDATHLLLRAERSGRGDGRIYTITATCTDGAGNSTTSNPVTVNVSHNITAPKLGAAFKIGSTVTFGAVFRDAAGLKHTASWGIDNANAKGTVTEPVGSKAGKVSGSYRFRDTGVYSLESRITNSAGVTSTVDTMGGGYALVVVYDPKGGYVTGGGAFDAPAGSFRSNPSATGTANYGFVSKYFKNATNPKGETQFDFSVAGFRFNSLNFDYLVVDGARAQYKGFGKVNGAAGYDFILTVTDGQAAGGDGTDRIRMKIWNKQSGDVVFDTQAGAPDNADPNVALPDSSSVVIQP